MKRLLIAATVGGALLATSGAAQAQSIIRQPNAHVSKVEFEIHAGFGGFWNRWGFAISPGFRIGIPVMPNGFVRSINNSVAISFGADVFLYPFYRDYFY